MSRYILYADTLCLNEAPLESTKSLLDCLGIFYVVFEGGKRDIGEELKFLNKKGYYSIFKDCLQKAKDDSRAILAFEYSSYKGLLGANEFFGLDVEIKHISSLLKTKFEKAKIKHNFKDFKAYAFLKDNENIALLQQTAVSVFESKEQEDGYFLLPINKEISYKMAGEIVFDAYDSGCDMIIVDDIRSFYMLDEFQNKISNSIKRPLGENGMSIVFMSEFLLFALGEVDGDFLDLHKTKVNFL